MTKELFILCALVGGLSGWIAVALFYTIMHGVFGHRGPPGLPGPQGIRGMRGLTGAPGACKCQSSSRRAKQATKSFVRHFSETP